jgi:hypothetical protein
VDQVPNPRMAYIVAKNKERKQRRRAHLLEMLGGKCVRCGTTDGLVFDHIDPSTKAFTIGGNLERPWDVLLAEVRKTQLLCPPCHKIKGTEDRPESPHGTIYRYSDLGCRCDLCRAANAAKSARRRARLKDSGDFSTADVESQPHNPRSEAPSVDTAFNLSAYGSSTALAVRGRRDRHRGGRAPGADDLRTQDPGDAGTMVYPG